MADERLPERQSQRGAEGEVDKPIVMIAPKVERFGQAGQAKRLKPVVIGNKGISVASAERMQQQESSDQRDAWSTWASGRAG